MPLIERKSKDMIAWEDWQKHLNKKFGIKEEPEEPAEAKSEEASEEKQDSSEQTVSLEFLEKPVE